VYRIETVRYGRLEKFLCWVIAVDGTLFPRFTTQSVGKVYASKDEAAEDAKYLGDEEVFIHSW
jgi:hypothetical protein